MVCSTGIVRVGKDSRSCVRGDVQIREVEGERGCSIQNVGELRLSSVKQLFCVLME